MYDLSVISTFLIHTLWMSPNCYNLVQAICLPEPGQEFYGKVGIATGWGRFQRGKFDENGEKRANKGQSPLLRYVHLKVSTKKYNHYKMFGTEVPTKGPMKDVCSGDSGLNLQHF